MRRLVLVRHASTDAVRTAAFGADEPLDARGREAAARLRLPRGEVWVSPALRARETAACAGLAVSGVEPALAEGDFGRWAGLTLRDVEPDALREWMTDPAAAPHGGETLLAVLERVRGWLAEQARLDGTAVAITHGGVVKAAVVEALGAPPAAFWRIDVAPLSITELHAHDGRWTVTRVNDRGGVAAAGDDVAAAGGVAGGDDVAAAGEVAGGDDVAAAGGGGRS